MNRLLVDRPRSGYILVEAVVAMVVLSVSLFIIHASIRQALQTRGQAMDYAALPELVDRVQADLALQPVLVESNRAGQFEAPYDRFHWEYAIERVDLTPPERPLRRPEEPGEPPFKFDPGADRLTRLRVTISWTRGSAQFEEHFVTLFGPGKLWTPPEARNG